VYLKQDFQLKIIALKPVLFFATSTESGKIYFFENGNQIKIQIFGA
jgi:hypothetical protein